MFKIKETSNAGILFPDEENILNYTEYDFASLISILGVYCITSGRYYKLGDSNITVEIIQTEKKNEEGIEEIKEYAVDLVKLIKKAIPQMSSIYAEYYDHYVKDFEKNGLKMPFYGKLI